MIRSVDVLDEIRALPPIECGLAAKKYFSFADGWRNLNHGSFGTFPTCLKPVLQHYQSAAEARPDKFIRYEYPSLLDVSRHAIAEHLHAPVEACVFMSNATTGINTVLRALDYEQDDVIIYFSTIYGACERTVTFITETRAATSKKVNFTYPISDQALCDQFEKVIAEIKAEGKKPKIAIYDTISSLPGVRMPFEGLTKICRKHDILSCIDGAHSAGQIEMNLSELDPDFYVSNCHKWLHVPRGCAVFYVPERNQGLVRSTVPTSHGFIAKPTPNAAVVPNPLPPSTKSVFITNFEFVGTLDNSPYLCIPAALEWRKKLTWKDLKGDQAIMAYNEWLACAAAELVAKKLGSEIMDNEEKTLTKCSMTNVRLPLSIEALVDGDMPSAVRIAQWIAKTVVEQHDTFIAILIHNNAFWVRLSGQVYLTLDDFEYGAKVLMEICEHVKKGQWKL